jgi:acetyl-CoA carboxylase alpha subunit
MEYLEFEKPIEELMEQYDKCSLVGEESGIDVKLACSQLEDKIIAEKKISTASLHHGRKFSFPAIQTGLML